MTTRNIYNYKDNGLRLKRIWKELRKKELKDYWNSKNTKERLRIKRLKLKRKHDKINKRKMEYIKSE